MYNKSINDNKKLFGKNKVGVKYGITNFLYSSKCNKWDNKIKWDNYYVENGVVCMASIG